MVRFLCLLVLSSPLLFGQSLSYMVENNVFSPERTGEVALELVPVDAERSQPARSFVDGIDETERMKRFQHNVIEAAMITRLGINVPKAGETLFPDRRKNLKYLQFSLSFKCSYESLLHFFDALARINIYHSVESLILEYRPTADRPLRGRITLQAPIPADASLAEIQPPERYQVDRLMLHLFQELTDTLPGNTWLAGLEIEEGMRLSLHGQTERRRLLPPAMADMTILENPRLIKAKDKGSQAFSLAARLNPEPFL